jgi:hypothetical protein
VTRRLQSFTFREQDGGEFLVRVKCPVLASGAAGSIYFKPELSAGKIVERLRSLDEGEKEGWRMRDCRPRWAPGL